MIQNIINYNFLYNFSNLIIFLGLSGTTILIMDEETKYLFNLSCNNYKIFTLLGSLIGILGSIMYKQQKMIAIDTLLAGWTILDITYTFIKQKRERKGK